jgi:acetyl-CoA decarbonylase/synthase complex subunit beta
MPASVKERVKEFIPKEVADKIATENEAKNVEELRSFLEAKGHPVVERWKAKEAEVVAAEAEAVEEKEVPAVPVAELAGVPITAGGFKIILKDAKIRARKVIIRAIKTEKEKR